MVTTWDIERTIDDLATSPVKRFYPTYVAKQTGLPLKNVFEYLLILVKAGKLNLKWEIRCPNYDCIRTIQIADELPTDLNQLLICSICGEQTEVTLDIIFPAFEVSSSYKEYIGTLKKKDHRKLISKMQ